MISKIGTVVPIRSLLVTTTRRRDVVPVIAWTAGSLATRQTKSTYEVRRPTRAIAGGALKFEKA